MEKYKDNIDTDIQSENDGSDHHKLFNPIRPGGGGGGGGGSEAWMTKLTAANQKHLTL